MNDIAGDNKKWFKGIDSLRFILALIVLLSHFSNPFVAILLNSTNKLLKFAGYFLANAFDGTAAVIAFFIVSGFVIHYPNKNGIKNIKTFWTRRFLRILIPLVIIFLVGIKFNHPDKSVVWSLICELVYYTLYPSLAKIPINWFYKFLFSYVVAMILIIFAAQGDVLALFRQTDDKYHGYYWQLGSFLTWIVGLPVWLLGVLIAEYIDKSGTVHFNKILLYRISVFVLSVLLVAGKIYWHISYIVSMNLFAIVACKWLQAEITYFKNHSPNPLLEKMGKFSYSLYLCHPIIYLVLGLWLNNSLITYPIFILLTIIVSYLFYLAVEKPAHLLAIRLSNNIVLAKSKID
jgi:peptidoglycan/LPS O-acetylase OafA/YrhL